MVRRGKLEHSLYFLLQPNKRSCQLELVISMEEAADSTAVRVGSLHRPALVGFEFADDPSPHFGDPERAAMQAARAGKGDFYLGIEEEPAARLLAGHVLNNFWHTAPMAEVYCGSFRPIGARTGTSVRVKPFWEPDGTWLFGKELAGQMRMIVDTLFRAGLEDDRRHGGERSRLRTVLWPKQRKIDRIAQFLSPTWVRSARFLPQFAPQQNPAALSPERPTGAGEL